MHHTSTLEGLLYKPHAKLLSHRELPLALLLCHEGNVFDALLLLFVLMPGVSCIFVYTI